MLKYQWLPLSIAIMSVAACKSTTGSENITSDSTISAQSTIHNSHPAYGSVDPDPTDNIPAGNYLPNACNLETAEKVKITLRDSLLKDDLQMIDSSQRKFMIHDIDLNNDGEPETFVAFPNAGSCGNEGCSVYILNDDATLNSIITVSEFPIVALNSISRGWKDLLVTYQGTQYRLQFEGKSYPRFIGKGEAYTQNLSDNLPRVLDFQHAAYPWFRF